MRVDDESSIRSLVHNPHSTQLRGNISSRFSINSEAFASELIENIEEMFPRSYIHSSSAMLLIIWHHSVYEIWSSCRERNEGKTKEIFFKVFCKSRKKFALYWYWILDHKHMPIWTIWILPVMKNITSLYLLLNVRLRSIFSIITTLTTWYRI